jgi:SAM-dependent methyltransferase
VIEAYGEDIPLEAAGFDLVVARQVLHHASDLPQFCREMARLAREGGQIVTLRDHVISGPEQMDAFLAAHPLHHLYGGENAFTLAQYRGALEAAGLKVVDEFRSFQSVINYDPGTPDQIRRKLADRFGPVAPIAGAGLAFMPFGLIAELAAAFDRRPGRHVTYHCRKEASASSR